MKLRRKKMHDVVAAWTAVLGLSWIDRANASRVRAVAITFMRVIVDQADTGVMIPSNRSAAT
jgi:hypothetical protein